jgi:hypothetical protein
MDYARKVSQRHFTHIIRGDRGFVGFKRNVGFFGFFNRLVLRVTGTFLTEALVVLDACTAGSTSCAEGSSAITV